MNRLIKARCVSATTFVGRDEAKICVAASVSASLKTAGTPCVLTKGVFDLLHAGHLRLFAFCAEQARQIKGRVVVAVASDAVVRARKGPGRPIQTQAHRMAQVAAVSGVDYVLLSDEHEPIRMIEEFRPAIYVKGADTAIGQNAPDGDHDVEIVSGDGRNGDLITAADVNAEILIFTDSGELSTSELIRTIRDKGGDAEAVG